MAEAPHLNQELFTCPICLDLLKVPVTILCGHSYCKDCLNSFWDQEDLKGVYSCPQCRQTFCPRPVLNKNNIFAQLVDQLKKSIIQNPSENPGDEECDVCAGRNLAAFKCLESARSDPETRHQLHPGGTPTRQIEKICSRHNKLRETQRRFQQRIQVGEKEVQELRKAVETLKHSAQTSVEDSEKIFAEIIRAIERRRSEVTKLIRDQAEAEVSRAEGLLKQLEQEIAELKRRDVELEQLAHSQDDAHFLQTFPSLSTLSSKVVSTIMFSESLSFEAVKTSVGNLKLRLEDVCQEEASNISAAVSTGRAVLTEPVTREDFLQCKFCKVPTLGSQRSLPVSQMNHLCTPAQDSCPLSLDSDTAYKHLYWSTMDRTLEWTNKPLSCRDNPDRFDIWGQVLCREGLSGRCYWEVEWSGDCVHIAVSYKSIRRKGWTNECGFGFNDKSWSLILTSSGSSFKHKNEDIKLPLVGSPRIGVYVDHMAGILAFYNVSPDTMTLLHKVQTTFTHELYPGFTIGPFSRSTVKLL